jgi:ATP-binding cassette subfamily B protein
MDTAILPALAVMPRGWMIVGLLGLAPAFIEGTGSAVGLAIGLGGMLLANRALSGISGGLSALSSAAVSWAQVGTLFKAATEQASNEPFQTTVQIEGQVHHQGDAVAQPARVLVDAHQLDFSYPQSSEKVLNGLDLQIKHGERILLVGTSGGGKSTLARLLVGLHTPDAGLLLLNGLDRHTLGESWHQFATEAPQFHDNHILSGTLGFNLLMGRQWPASAQDLQEAADMCEELGLGELLRRMPSGMTQMVGETGWQLSHGERSRIFLARALLQNAQLTILDESFAALDPQTLEKCLTCVLARARTLMVIAHP